MALTGRQIYNYKKRRLAGRQIYKRKKRRLAIRKTIRTWYRWANGYKA